MDDERFEELAIGHLLGGLDPGEAEVFAAERARRGEAAEVVVRRLREVLGAIALGAPQTPPPALRGRVLDAAQREAPLRIVPLRPRAWPWAAAAILAVLALGLGAWNLRLRDERIQLLAELAAARRDLAAADSAAGAARRELALLASPTARPVALTGTAELPAARARAFVDPTTGRAILYAYDLPILGPDAVYELWAIRGSTPRAAGTFRPDASGRARMEIADAEVLEGLEALAVTIEPAPGGPAPTGRMVLVSES